jgi:predicted permease
MGEDDGDSRAISLRRDVVTRLRAWIVRLGGVFAGPRRDRDLADEIESHLQHHIDDGVRAGLPPGEAKRQARIALGSIDAITEQYRDRRGLPWLDNIVRDARHAVRMMRKAPAAAAVAIATLALGIGVNTAVFSALDAVVLRPLDVDHPEQLARIYRSTSADRFGALPYADFEFYRGHARAFSDMAILAFGMSVSSRDVTVSQPSTPHIAGALGFQLPQLVAGGARPISCALVSGSYFHLLGVDARLGRMLVPADDQIGAAPALVLSGNFWQRQFHADSAVIGSTLHLDDVPFTVVGVTPIDFLGTSQNVPDAWVPAVASVRLGRTTAAQRADPDVLGGWVEARLAPGATLASAEAELNMLAGETPRNDPRPSRRAEVTVVSGRTYAPPLDATAWSVVIAAIVSVLLLLVIACTNVASLMLARAAVRRREIAVRLSLGASRGRLIQQLLTESLLQAALAGAAGLIASWWMLRMLVAEVSASLPEFWGTIALHTDPDWRVFGYALFVSAVAGVGFGLTPALRASRVDVTGALKEDSGTSAAPRWRRRVLDLLVLAQLAACLVLLVSSAMLLRSSSAAVRADPGFETTHVLIMQPLVDRRSAQQHDLSLIRFAETLRALPGVQFVAQAAHVPVGNARALLPIMLRRGADAAVDPTAEYDAPFNMVSPDYFSALSVPILRGRTFTSEETDANAAVAIVSARFAERLFQGRDALGLHIDVAERTAGIHFADDPEHMPRGSLQIVGIAADVRSLDVTTTDPAYVYVPLPPQRRSQAITLVRVAGDPGALLPSIGADLGRTAPGVPLFAGPLSMTISFNPRFVVSRIGGTLAALIAGIGLLVASLGVYGMVGYNVAQRTREIGIRMALGAEVRTVMALTVRDGARPVAWGIAVGLLLSAIASKLLGALLFGVGAFDAPSFGVASAVLVAVALLAVWMPARRATRVDPMVALRHD